MKQLEKSSAIISVSVLFIIQLILIQGIFKGNYLII